VSRDYSAWLIERRDGTQTRWLRMRQHEDEWVTDASLATHFSRRQDADEFGDSMTIELYICEHSWPGCPPNSWNCPQCNMTVDGFDLKCRGCGRKVDYADAPVKERESKEDKS